MYNLQKYSGMRSRFTCPNCGKPHCFVRYVDENGEYLHESVGRCNHESSCGYHYTPKQFFADHPDQKPGKDWRYDRVPVMAGPDRPSPVIPSVASVSPLCTIPEHIVTRSVRQNYDSHLITFLRTFLDPFIIEGLIDEYQIGVTKSKGTIFFQIDAQGLCRTGKIMLYNPEDGHRIKDPEVPSRITWVHSVMKQAGMLPKEWELTQCLFGEHLLSIYPDKPVALVESEKTAVICAGLMPKYLWVATGGKSQLNPDRLAVLAGRKVIAFPDVDAFDDWTRKLTDSSLDITISPLLQQEATPEDIEAHIDIADWLIRHCHPGQSEGSPSNSRDFLLAARFLDPDSQSEVEALIEELGLEFWGAERDTPLCHSERGEESPK
jgi:hypothetical protein